MNPLIAALLAALAVSAVSLIGILIAGKHKRLNDILFLLVSFSAGSLLGGAFFHLLPESLESAGSLDVFKLVLMGFVVFYLLERVLRWHHCHKMDCDEHKVLGYQNLVGDGVHNFIDGLIIVSAFSVSLPLGIAVTVSVVLHEIPQEIGEFGVLLYSGFSKTKAVMFNLLSAFLAVAGVLVGYLLITSVNSIVSLLLPFAAGGFMYIAATDLVPELHREKNIAKSLMAFMVFMIAIVFMLWLKSAE